MAVIGVLGFTTSIFKWFLLKPHFKVRICPHFEYDQYYDATIVVENHKLLGKFGSDATNCEVILRIKGIKRGITSYLGGNW